VSATETPAATPPEEQPAPRRCPRCAAPLEPQQEWCLNCGADVGSRIVGAPSWRGPVALVIGLLAIAAIALILALVELAGDAEQVTPPPAATATPAPSAAAIPSATPTPDSITIPPATADQPSGSPEIADWPDGKDAWTVVLESSSTRAAAEARAKELAGQGVPVGILDSNGYSSLEPGHFVVFSGQYDSKRAADQALEDLASQVTGGYVRHVIPSTATQHGGATVAPSPSPSSTAAPLTP
jgi:septal ring-binding cell division protein DamX